jgi:hypothetical protein
MTVYYTGLKCLPFNFHRWSWYLETLLPILWWNKLVGAGGAVADAACKWSILCLQIPITLHKEPELDPEGREVLKCGFKIGGGIDQDYRKSPQGYTDNVCVSDWHLWPVCIPYRTLYAFRSHNKYIFSYKASRNQSIDPPLMWGIEGGWFPSCVYFNDFRSVKIEIFLWANNLHRQDFNSHLSVVNIFYKFESTKMWITFSSNRINIEFLCAVTLVLLLSLFLVSV